MVNPPPASYDDDLGYLCDVVQHPGSGRTRSVRSTLPRLSSRFSAGMAKESSSTRRVSRRLVPIGICILSLALFLSINLLVTRSKEARILTLNITTNEANLYNSVNANPKANAISAQGNELSVNHSATEEAGRIEKLENKSSEIALTTKAVSSPHREMLVTEEPKVYTFHIRRQATIPLEEQVFLDVWEQRWKEAGYSPRVLFIEDAMKHPNFANFSTSVDGLIAASQRKRDPELRYCYFRYLAMANVGGGMMVDIDTRPAGNATKKEPPSTFSLYCSTGRQHRHGSQDWLFQLESQSGTPCAASGSAEAWLKVAQHLPWAFEQNDDKRKWTDMHGLVYLTQYGEVQVVKEKKVTSWKPRAFDKCSFRTV